MGKPGRNQIASEDGILAARTLYSTGMNSPHRTRILIALFLLLPVLPVWAGLTRPLPPEDLEPHAAVIVEATVQSVRHGLDESTGRLGRYIDLDVSRVHRGPDDLNQVTLREAGGVWGNWVHHVTGVPVYTEGDRVLVFLEARADRSLRTVGMHLGVFRIDDSDRERLALRDISGEGTFPQLRMDRRTEAWKWSELKPTLRRARRSTPDIKWLAQPREISRVRWDPGPSPLTTGTPRSGLTTTLQQNGNQTTDPGFAPLNASAPARWSAAADGQTLTFDVDPANAPILPAGTTITEIERAMSAWSDVPESRLTVTTGNTSLIYVGGGYGSPTAVYTGMNVILFDDPYDDISDPSGCSGVLGIGGYWAYSGPIETVNGLDFRPIAQAYVIFANGFGCLLSSANNVGELALHELGHAMGFGHSTVNDAAMRSAFYGNRGVRVGDDDADAAQCHYPHSYQWLAPAGGELLEAGALLSLSWSRSAESGSTEGTVDLEYREDDLSAWTSLSSATTDDGSFGWTLPALDSNQVRLRIRRQHRTSFGAPYPDACSTAISETFEVRPAAIPVAGTVPDGVSAPPLRLSLDAGGLLTLNWAASCTAEATGYSVYAGTIGDLRTGTFSPTPVTCMAGTDLTESFVPPAGDLYYLVAPMAGTLEGGLGTDSAGLARAVPGIACAPREAATANCPQAESTSQSTQRRDPSKES